MLCVPTARVEVVKVATPLLRLELPMEVVPSRKLTVPVGVRLNPCAVTVAENVTACPKMEVLDEEVSAVAVGARLVFKSTATAPAICPQTLLAISHHDVRLAVAVDIAQSHAERSVSSGRECDHRLHGPVTVTDQHAHVPAATVAVAANGRAVHHHHVGFAVTVYVRDIDRRCAEFAGWVSNGSLKSSVAVTQQNGDITLIDGDAGTAVRHNDVRLAVAVQIREYDRVWVNAAGVRERRGLKSSVAIAQQHADIARVANLSGALMSNHYVRLAVSVHVADNHRKDNQPTRDERHFWLESSVAVTQQYAAAATVRAIAGCNQVGLAVTVHVGDRDCDGAISAATERDRNRRLEGSVAISE